MAMGGAVEVIVEVVEIPDHTVGLVIGRGGEQISNIQAQSGCRVQMAGESNPQGMRQCTLQGTREHITKARAMISDIINRAGAKIAGQNGNGTPAVQPGGIITTEILVPGPKCGLIIGKSGETIKNLQVRLTLFNENEFQEQLGVKMLLIQETQAVSLGPKPLRISGTYEKVEQAKRMVEELLNANEDRGTTTIKSVGEVIVPRATVGIIIGKGGETIKKLAAESGAKIQFKQDEDQNQPERTAILQGSPEQIAKATQLISELVHRTNQNGQQEVFYMHVPANKTGLVIGKGGDTIKQINGESGAHVELSRDPPPNPNEKVFVIKGTPYQIHHAQHIIRIKVGDIPPGTPVPPFSGPGGPIQASYTPGMDVGGISQWGAPGAQNGFSAPGQDSNWNQLAYGQNAGAFAGAAQAAYAVQQFAQGQGQQPGAPGTAINPQTGQPDYSRQWIEYYRSMGMHDQAALIEQQVLQQKAAAAGMQPGGVQSFQPQQFNAY